MGVHNGHRDRMRERFFRNGLSTFNEIEALELLLYYAIPQRDTNPLSHALLDHFGSLFDVLNASEQELCEVPGVGVKTAALLKIVPEIARMSEIGQSQRLGKIERTEDAINFLRPYFRDLRMEMVLLVCLDSAKRIICTEELGRGTPSGVSFDIRQMVETVLKRKANSILIAHNHPDGQAMASHEDDSTTRSIFSVLQPLGIDLYDHIIMVGDSYVSYRRSGALDLFHYRY